MSSLPIVAGVTVTTDKEGRFNLNALHKASGLNVNKAPSQWLRTQTAQELISHLEKETMQICTVSSEGRNGGTFAHELLAVSYAGWISPAFQLQVNQVFIDYKTGSIKEKKDQTGLLQFRKARALKMATESAKDICLMFPSLSEKSKQVIYAGLVNPIAGAEIIPLPKLEQKLYTAGDIGKVLNISSNKVGKIANKLGLKTDNYGMYVLDKSKYSSKQVQNFMYNDKGLEAIRLALVEAS